MKKIMKFKRILVKTRHKKKRFPTNKLSRKNEFKKNYLYHMIESPHNTNEFLVNNQSSSFYSDDEEESVNIPNSAVTQLEDDINAEINLFDLNDNETTNEESMILNEKLGIGKEQMKKYPNGLKK